MKRCHEAESIDVVALHKKINRENMTRLCMAESHDSAANTKKQQQYIKIEKTTS
jgi:hypothetical protein